MTKFSTMDFYLRRRFPPFRNVIIVTCLNSILRLGAASSYFFPSTSYVPAQTSFRPLNSYVQYNPSPKAQPSSFWSDQSDSTTTTNNDNNLFSRMVAPYQNTAQQLYTTPPNGAYYSNNNNDRYLQADYSSQPTTPSYTLPVQPPPENTRAQQQWTAAPYYAQEAQTPKPAAITASNFWPQSPKSYVYESQTMPSNRYVPDTPSNDVSSSGLYGRAGSTFLQQNNQQPFAMPARQNSEALQWRSPYPAVSQAQSQQYIQPQQAAPTPTAAITARQPPFFMQQQQQPFAPSGQRDFGRRQFRPPNPNMAMPSDNNNFGVEPIPQFSDPVSGGAGKDIGRMQGFIGGGGNAQPPGFGFGAGGGGMGGIPNEMGDGSMSPGMMNPNMLAAQENVPSDFLDEPFGMGFENNQDDQPEFIIGFGSTRKKTRQQSKTPLAPNLRQQQQQPAQQQQPQLQSAQQQRQPQLQQPTSQQSQPQRQFQPQQEQQQQPQQQQTPLQQLQLQQSQPLQPQVQEQQQQPHQPSPQFFQQSSATSPPQSGQNEVASQAVPPAAMVQVNQPHTETTFTISQAPPQQPQPPPPALVSAPAPIVEQVTTSKPSVTLELAIAGGPVPDSTFTAESPFANSRGPPPVSFNTQPVPPRQMDVVPTIAAPVLIHSVTIPTLTPAPIVIQNTLPSLRRTRPASVLVRKTGFHNITANLIHPTYARKVLHREPILDIPIDSNTLVSRNVPLTFLNSLPELKSTPHLKKARKSVLTLNKTMKAKPTIVKQKTLVWPDDSSNKAPAVVTVYKPKLASLPSIRHVAATWHQQDQQQQQQQSQFSSAQLQAAFKRAYVNALDKAMLKHMLLAATAKQSSLRHTNMTQYDSQHNFKTKIIRPTSQHGSLPMAIKFTKVKAPATLSNKTLSTSAAQRQKRQTDETVAQNNTALQSTRRKTAHRKALDEQYRSDEIQGGGRRRIAPRVNPKSRKRLACTKIYKNKCYAFVETRKTMDEAVNYCQQHGFNLASMTKDSQQVTDTMIEKQFGTPTNATDCTARITMLANYDPKMRYGTYAFTAGPKCSYFKVGQNQSSTFDVCPANWECSRVDWLTPSSFICERNISPAPVSDNVCFDEFLVKDGFEFVVSCAPVFTNPNGAKGFLKMDISQDELVFREYPSMCWPLKREEILKDGEALRRAAWQKNLDYISVISYEGVVYCDTVQPTSAGNCRRENEGSLVGSAYALCKRPLPGSLNKTKTLAELWQIGVTVPVVLGDELSDEQRSLVDDAFQMTANNTPSCSISFTEVISGMEMGLGDFVRIGVDPFSDASDPQCLPEKYLPLGYNSGPTVIRLPASCFTSTRWLLRILLRVLGLPPEHIRADRDRWVHVDTARLDPSMLSYVQAQTLPGDFLRFQYAYDSVMHPRSNEFGIYTAADDDIYRDLKQRLRARAIIPTRGFKHSPKPFSPASGLNEIDAARLAYYYPCAEEKRTTTSRN